MKESTPTPLWATLLHMAGLLLAALGTSAYIKLKFIPAQLQSPPYALSIVALGFLIGLPRLYLKLKDKSEAVQEQ